MSLLSRYLAWKNKLSPAETYAVSHARDLSIPMPDGAVLLADHYYPNQGGKLPTVLIRSPYGRRTLTFDAVARLFAERGFQVLIQSCRGTFGSSGNIFPFKDDRTDGLATIAWLKQQPWYSGEFAMFGPSYLGYVQWAIADAAGPDLKALVPVVTAAEFLRVTAPGDTMALDTLVTFVQRYTDFFARLCDVFPSGKSINLSDGIIRLIPGRFVPDAAGV